MALRGPGPWRSEVGTLRPRLGPPLKDGRRVASRGRPGGREGGRATRGRHGLRGLGTLRRRLRVHDRRGSGTSILGAALGLVARGHPRPKGDGSGRQGGGGLDPSTGEGRVEPALKSLTQPPPEGSLGVPGGSVRKPTLRTSHFRLLRPCVKTARPPTDLASRRVRVRLRVRRRRPTWRSGGVPKPTSHTPQGSSRPAGTKPTRHRTDPTTPATLAVGHGWSFTAQGSEARVGRLVPGPPH